MKKSISTMRKNSEQGFTLLEILMALVIIAILAAVGITQFINYANTTKDAATRANLQILRAAIGRQYANLTTNCQDNTYTWPAYAALVANDITLSANTSGYAGTVHGGTMGTCMATDIDATAAAFLGGVQLPVNPWGLGISTQAGGMGNNVFDCTAIAAGTGKGANSLYTNATTGASYYVANTVANYAGNAATPCYPINNLDCSVTATQLAGVASSGVLPYGDGWCYDPTAGKIWANSANNQNSPYPTALTAGKTYGTENEF